ncbi:MAG: glycosyl hydrolase family 17 protein [Methylomonas sp.]|jgi:exo-beta-1,3-glucanase (GH17 family)|uniref:glycoside hydrolase family 17 protein n=1 Tax=Methylomonas sp. TaxID=418 RepID=UPI0025CF7363|nr:glycosyl hydrolase family 17 protein [Methylomonas sp.]MCK9605950.1 glycosyl hydrolase family 17 protein [Methylomonas sp.]
MPSVKILSSLLLIIVIHATFAWFHNQARDAGPDVPSGKLRSLSFAPYHDGFSPITRKFPLPEHVDQDVQAVANKTYSIRTYSVRGGMQPTPAFARQYGVDMMMGAWLGDGHPENRIEIQTLIDAANQNWDVVKRVIVGNEVLLRKDMDIDTLIGYIRQVKQAIKQPVTYADVWSSYMQYPQLFKEVDFITIHILPYWEDEPVAIEHAAAHVRKIVRQITDKAHSLDVSKPILIGESGWPAIGRQRGAAVPSVVNEARFIRELIQVANQQGFDYNIVEAFNQPWKSNSEGVVGANWGLLDIDREPVFPLTGPVTENPAWIMHFAWATGFCLLVVGIGFSSLQRLSLAQLLVFLTFAQLFGIGLVNQADLLWHTSYSLWQQSYTLFMVAASAVLAGLLLQRCYAVLSKRASAQPYAQALRYGYLFFVALAIYKTYHLAWDGRYLSFPIAQFSIPALGVIAVAACFWLNQGRPRINLAELTGSPVRHPKQGLLSYLLGFGMLALIAGETYSFMSAYDFIQAHPDFQAGLPIALGYTLQNHQLLNWLLCALLLALPFWPARISIPPRE